MHFRLTWNEWRIVEFVVSTAFAASLYKTGHLIHVLRGKKVLSFCGVYCILDEMSIELIYIDAVAYVVLIWKIGSK